MSRWSRRESFLVGYVPGSIGIAFNTTLLLALAGHLAEGELAARVDGLRAKFQDKAVEVVGQVLLVESLLARVGVKAHPSPRSPRDFDAWADHVLAVGAQAGDPAAFRLGFLAGDALLVLQLAAVVRYLLEVEAMHPFLRDQAGALEGRYAAVVAAMDPALAPAFRAAPVAGPLAPLESAIDALIAHVGEYERVL